MAASKPYEPLPFAIGDVVKQRIEDVEREAEEIKHYIATA